MRNTIVYALMLLLAIGCKEKKKNTVKSYVIDTQRSTVQWTGYKTSEKTPVNGTFTEVNITQETASKVRNALAIDGTTFEIPISGLFSNDPTNERDPKLKTLFFGVMKNTTLLEGTFHINDESTGYIDLTMNGVTEQQPFDYTEANGAISLSATMDLKRWNTAAAVESIHKACELLHTGPDGISKTWDEVGLKAKIYFRAKK